MIFADAANMDLLRMWLSWLRHHADLFVKESFPDYLNLVSRPWFCLFMSFLMVPACEINETQERGPGSIGQVLQCLQPQAVKEDRKLALRLSQKVLRFAGTGTDTLGHGIPSLGGSGWWYVTSWSIWDKEPGPWIALEGQFAARICQSFQGPKTSRTSRIIAGHIFLASVCAEARWGNNGNMLAIFCFRWFSCTTVLTENRPGDLSQILMQQTCSHHGPPNSTYSTMNDRKTTIKHREIWCYTDNYSHFSYPMRFWVISIARTSTTQILTCGR